MKNKQKLVNRIIDFYLTGHNLKEEEAKAVISLKDEYKSINYTRSCETLKDEYIPDFSNWLKDNNYTEIEDTQFYCAGVEAGNTICETQCIGCDGFQRNYKQ